jgi:hypothetical protein
MPAVPFNPTVSVRNKCVFKEIGKIDDVLKYTQINREYRATLEKRGIATESSKQL